MRCASTPTIRFGRPSGTPRQLGKSTRVVFVAFDLTGQEVTRVDTVLTDTFTTAFGVLLSLGVDQDGGLQLAYHTPDVAAIARFSPTGARLSTTTFSVNALWDVVEGVAFAGDGKSVVWHGIQGVEVYDSVGNLISAWEARPGPSTTTRSSSLGRWPLMTKRGSWSPAAV